MTRDRLIRLRDAFAVWFRADPRALGLFRIAFGLLCLADVLRRVPWIGVFYSNEGVLTNHYGLFRPHADYTISLLHALGRPEEVAVFFGLTAVCLVFFTIGLYTRLFHALSAVAMLSIHSRNILLENGGDVVMNLWWVWTFFLPLGRRFSVDAVRRSLRARRERPAAGLAAPPVDDRPVRSLAVFAILWQLAVIYFFNTVHKDGPTWLEGTAIAYVLEQDRMVTGLGLWVREHVPLAVTRALTWLTLVIEGAAPMLLLSPVWTTAARRVAVFLLCGLHGSIWLLADVGLFSPVMMVSYLLLLTPPDLDALGRLLRRVAGREIVVYYDADCGVCHQLARVGARLDALRRVTWIGEQPDPPRPPGWSAARLAEARERSIVVWEPASGRVWTRQGALARLGAALPAGRPFAWLLKAPGVGHLVGALYDRVAANRARISAWLGLAACSMARGPAGAPTGGGDDDGATPPALRAGRRFGFWGAQALVAVLLFATGTQLLVENAWARARVKIHQPSWARALVEYGRLFQGWGMFSPDAPTTDGWLVIDAVLDDGRRVDPQTGQPPVFGPADARRLRWDQFWGSYSLRIASRRNGTYRQGLVDWLRAPVRRLKLGPEARVAAVTVYWIGDRVPDLSRPGRGEIFERFVVAEWPPPRAKRRP